MQINFYTSPKDEQLFVDYIYRQDGYFVVYKSGNQRNYPVLADVPLPPSRRSGVGSDHVITEYRRLSIVNTSICPVPQCRWGRKRPVFERNQLFSSDHQFQFEMIEFNRSYSDGLKLYPGRLWLNGIEDETTRFYQKLCRFVRSSFEKNKTGWWVGPTADEYCRSEGLGKANFGHPTYTLQKKRTKPPPVRRRNSPAQHSGILMWSFKFVIFPILAVAIGLMIIIYADTL